MAKHPYGTQEQNKVHQAIASPAYLMKLKCLKVLGLLRFNAYMKSMQKHFCLFIVILEIVASCMEDMIKILHMVGMGGYEMIPSV